MAEYEKITSKKIMGIRKALEKIRKSFEKEDSLSLRKISNASIEKTMLTREPKLVEVSLISYGLSKILSKPHYKEVEGWKKFKKQIEEELEEKGKEKGKRLHEVISIIHDFNEEAGNYIEGIIHHARVKQASRLYALGLSLNSASELTGAGEEELMQYIGATKISEGYTTTMPLRKRYEKTKEITGG